MSAPKARSVIRVVNDMTAHAAARRNYKAWCRRLCDDAALLRADGWIEWADEVARYATIAGRAYLAERS